MRSDTFLVVILNHDRARTLVAHDLQIIYPAIWKLTEFAGARTPASVVA